MNYILVRRWSKLSGVPDRMDDFVSQDYRPDPKWYGHTSYRTRYGCYDQGKHSKPFRFRSLRTAKVAKKALSNKWVVPHDIVKFVDFVPNFSL